MIGPRYAIPTRLARAVDRLIHRDGPEAHARRMAVIAGVESDRDRMPLTTEAGTVPGPASFACAADIAARECYDVCSRVLTADAVEAGIAVICDRRGVPAPIGATLAEVVARAVDKGWWRRQLRKEWMRRFEHTAIQLGLTHVRQDPYITRETALMQDRQNKANQQMLENRTATNEHGDTYSVAELAALGMGNKALRRGELMTRIRGFEEIAAGQGDAGMFWTITCPSKYHAVGGANGRYSGATPRDAQAYLCDVWKRIRSALKRRGIQPYGFRIAEPHSDGCPHWHMLLFVDSAQAAALEAIVRAYALAEDGDEHGAQDNRVKLVNIEAGKGTAAGYIAKYVSKNIDGTGVGDFKTFENGTTYVLVTDDYGNAEITPSQRVTYWSQVWGIRQFQQIGGAPVGVWRELRRIPADAVQVAPDAIRAAHAAVQKIESAEAQVAKQASFADYVMAQGGPTIGRRAVIQIAAREVTIVGRYATYTDKKPVGVYLAAQPQAVYEGVHYRWTISGSDASPGVAFDFPWTGVNNCTPEGADDGPQFDGQHVNFKEIRLENIEAFIQHSPRHEGWHLRHLQHKYQE